MRILHVVVLLLIVFASYGQVKNNNYPKIVLVIALVDTGKCEYQALKVMGDSVMVDTCFDSRTNLFTIDKVQSVNENPVFRQVQNLNGIKLRQLQESLESIRYCDYGMPYTIQLTDEKNKLEIFSLKRFTNCYPVSAKQLMELLDNYFRKHW